MNDGIGLKLGWAALCIFLAAALVLFLLQYKPGNTGAGRGEQTDRDTASLNVKSVVTTFRGDPRTSRAFTWYSETKTAGILQVARGNAPDAFDSEKTVIYEAQTTIVNTKKYGKQYSHKVEVTGLEPGSEYIYRIGEGKEGEWRNAVVFRTEGVEEETFTFLNVTDSQGMNKEDFVVWGRTLDSAIAQFPDASWILHNGDLTEDPTDEKAWDYFFSIPSDWLSRLPLMPVTGNHDEIDGESDRFTAHFYVPDNGEQNSNPGTTYSFDYGHAHIVVLNTESNLKQQAAWLKQDLENTDQTWLIAAIHRPAYGGNMYKKLDDWIAVFDEYGVDLVLQGHNHEYSRSFSLRGGEIVQPEEGTVYVTTNASGRKFNEKKEDQFYHAVHFQNGQPMYAGITVSEDTLTYRAFDIDGKLQDGFVLENRKK
ncbi:purple acid phosphatase family protein [Paenibacillus brevis]|uniref:Metallophosphoesterase family protein n=1 Tax=Paenibacillus brevis TaxID=2841508 RepID=A0ABS6FLF3_9BACL|nr:metallophosphoesterase family protein [Paenibacillus brevis]MBU5670979.1 metallophosphoesterase family protein [Paenibacillus brevis]